uniref:Uncharacterized protein n=1 Tax=Triticum urartu TaxID=4572 RepID=A0A8R7PVS9_TRIUA
MPVPPMEVMPVPVRNPGSGSIRRREPVHLEVQQREQPPDRGGERVVPPPTAGHGAATREPRVLVRVRVMVAVIRRRSGGAPLPGRPARDLRPVG